MKFVNDSVQKKIEAFRTRYYFVVQTDVQAFFNYFVCRNRWISFPAKHVFVVLNVRVDLSFWNYMHIHSRYTRSAHTLNNSWIWMWLRLKAVFSDRKCIECEKHPTEVKRIRIEFTWNWVLSCVLACADVCAFQWCYCDDVTRRFSPFNYGFRIDDIRTWKVLGFFICRFKQELKFNVWYALRWWVSHSEIMFFFGFVNFSENSEK